MVSLEHLMIADMLCLLSMITYSVVVTNVAYHDLRKSGEPLCTNKYEFSHFLLKMLYLYQIEKRLYTFICNMFHCFCYILSA